jgi:hypothetical protein
LKVVSSWSGGSDQVPLADQFAKQTDLGKRAVAADSRGMSLWTAPQLLAGESAGAVTNRMGCQDDQPLVAGRALGRPLVLKNWGRETGLRVRMRFDNTIAHRKRDSFNVQTGKTIGNGSTCGRSVASAISKRLETILRCSHCFSKNLALPQRPNRSRDASGPAVTKGCTDPQK